MVTHDCNGNNGQLGSEAPSGLWRRKHGGPCGSYSYLTLSSEDEDHRHSAYLGVCPYYY